mmetsp:Transcript_22354/g.48627  ORF Transcript_22354/g.48627 Transcript_22354/m.48627 type:complete len:342 (+) Transcript_22354:83-1108(+)
MAPPVVGRKRAVKIEPGVVASSSSSRPSKQAKTSSGNSSNPQDEALKAKFVALFGQAEFAIHGVPNSALKKRFGQKEYERLAPVINQFLADSRLTMSEGNHGGRKELFYTLVSEDLATKFKGLDVSARMVYQVIEKAGNMGVWTKDIKKETNLQNQALNKIFKALESRRLIKQVKSIAAKAKKLFMLYELTPSTELTGGVWYSDMEFDHGFITELRTFFMHCVRRMNNGNGVTLKEITNKMDQAKISRVNLGVNDVRQLMQTLVYDHLVEQVFKPKSAVAAGYENEDDEGTQSYYVASRRVSTMCEFKMWGDVLSPDFHFRTIRFEDGVALAPREPHYHTP